MNPRMASRRASGAWSCLELDPSLRFDRYIVERETLAYSGCDHFTPEQLRAVKATGWAVMEREELLQEWRGRT